MLSVTGSGPEFICDTYRRNLRIELQLISDIGGSKGTWNVQVRLSAKGTEIGISVLCTQNPVFGDFCFNAAADRPTRSSRAIRYRCKRIPSGTKTNWIRDAELTGS